MKSLPHLLAFLIASMLATAASLAAAAPSLQSVAINIEEASTEPKTCAALQEAIAIQLLALKRFDPKATTTTPDHKLSISCLADKVEAHWDTAIRVGKKVTYRRVSEGSRPFSSKTLGAEKAEAEYPSLALLLVKELLGSLPWDGEVVALTAKPPAAAKLNDLDLQVHLPAGWKRVFATTSTGYANNESMAHCLAIEIGQVAPGSDELFQPKALGIIASIGPFQSFAEIWLPPTAAAKAGRRLLFRFADPNLKDRMVKRAKASCRQALSLDETGTIDNLLAGNFRAALSTEVIELNGINQRIGINTFTFRANNGQKISRGYGVYVHNNVTVGDLFLVDFSLLKELQTAAYEPLFLNQEFKSSFNLAEAYTSLYYNFDPEWMAYGGLGFAYTKINVPYEPPEGLQLPAGTEVAALQDDGTATETTVTEIPTRPKTLAPALAIGTSFRGDDISFNTRLSVSLSSAGPHTAVNMSLDYRLTRTWYTGLNLYIIRLGDTNAGAPGGVLPSVGAHIGFDLKRTRGNR